MPRGFESDGTMFNGSFRNMVRPNGAEVKMNEILTKSLVLAAAIAMAGCCTMPSRHQPEAGKCPACGTAAEQSCPQCGMPTDQCTCTVQPFSDAEIYTSALKFLIDSGVGITLVDARVGRSYDGRRIATAIHLRPDAQDNEIQLALPSKEALIVTYSSNLTCPAVRALAHRLGALDYKHVMEYPQGIEGWVAEGNVVARNSSVGWPPQSPGDDRPPVPPGFDGSMGDGDEHMVNR